MASSHPTQANPPPIRLWPGVLLVVLQWLLWVVVPLVAPDYAVIGILGGVAGGAAVLVWWLFFSRAPWIDRLGAIVVIAIAVVVARQLTHESVAKGFMGRMPFMLSPPLWSAALVASAAIGRHLSHAAVRRTVMAASILLGCAALALVRTGGVSGAGAPDLHWRWSLTAEQRLLAQTAGKALHPPAASGPDGSASSAVPPASPEPAAPAASEKKPPLVSTNTRAETASTGKTPPASTSSLEKVPDLPPGPRPQWPGFRGPARDNVIRNVRIATDWSSTPPVELWRRPVGPGWSSFAVHGDLIYTQEQRGEYEIVACYRVSTGEPVWAHRDNVRFVESEGGVGPRGTPAVHDGRVYTLGATGIVNALDARTGARLWSRNAKDDSGAPAPGWGFTGSPLVVGSMVIVSASGRLVGYDPATGTPRWTRKTLGGAYSSPHRVTIDGVTQVLMASGGGLVSVSPSDGTVLWEHPWETGVAIVQPAVATEHDIIFAGGDSMGGQGLRRVALSKAANGWTTEEKWTSRGLKPYFNDFVVHKGHAYGFDRTILSCINLDDGERKWKGGRYGAGQMLLLADQDLLLVLSEEGELVLVNALPDKHTEVARFKAIEGKTWNHPVFVGSVLLVRNGEEMAAFRLPGEGQ